MYVNAFIWFYHSILTYIRHFLLVNKKILKKYKLTVELQMESAEAVENFINRLIESNIIDSPRDTSSKVVFPSTEFLILKLKNVA